MSTDRALAFIGIAVSALGAGIAVLLPQARSVGWAFVALGVLSLLTIPALHLFVRRFAETQQLVSETAGPRVVFDQVRHSRVRLAPAVNDNEWVEVWQLWFRNHGDNDGADRTARNLTAFVEFCDDDWRAVTTMVGQWAITRMPEHIGWDSLKSAIDLPAVLVWAKLMFIVQDSTVVESMRGDTLHTERGTYALAGENLHERPRSADHPRYYLPPNIRRARVTLTAENMREREFQFLIQRTADGAIESARELRP